MEIQVGMNNKSKQVTGKGHQILAMLNQDYQVALSPLVDELMAHPDSQYTLKILKAHR